MPLCFVKYIGYVLTLPEWTEESHENLPISSVRSQIEDHELSKEKFELHPAGHDETTHTG
jgi:hypothetical protein